VLRRAVIFGAGNVGRGFLGQLFSESGYLVTFVDIDVPLIETMRSRRSYTIRLVDNERTQEVRVGPVTGLLSCETEAVAVALAAATLGATAVGARALPQIAPLVAAGVALRARKGVTMPLNIIVCENLRDAATVFRGLVHEALDAPYAHYLATQIGFVGTVIGRMVPELAPELRAEDPTLIVAEPYKELPVDGSGFVGEAPQVVGMELCGNFELYTARKLYLHNMGHAVLGYLGYRRGHVLAYKALEDPEIRPIFCGAMEEALKGIVSHYGASEEWLRAHVADLTARFANRVLADSVFRLARDPLRKLAASDRLVGAARMSEMTGVSPLNLAWAIAGALSFDSSQDPTAVELQERIAAEGVESVLESVCEISRDEPLGVAILGRYRRLHEKDRWL